MIEPSVRLNEYTQVVDRTFLFVLGAVIEKGRIDKHGKGRSFSTRLALGNNFNFSGNEIPRMLNRIHTVTSGVTWDRFASYVLRVSESTRQVIDTSTLSGYQEEN
jgi:hypothetical protein